MSFQFEFTKEHLQQIIPKAKDLDLWYAAINKHLPEYSITTLNRVAMFMAQCGHESGGFTVLQENLNYRASRLAAVFPKYFKNTDPNSYAGHPEKIANKVYANRMGNGDEKSGDGWRFRGRGIIQITGRTNYTLCSNTAWKGDDLLKNPDLLCSPDGAVLSACWYWGYRNINAPSDQKDVTAVTKLINGGTLGLDDRSNLFKKALAILTPQPASTIGV